MRALVVLLCMTALAYATPSDDLAQARKAFREGQFSIALEKYNALLYPELRLASTDDLVDAYIGLGVCRLETGDSSGAKREFEKALELDPSHQLDPLIITNKQAIELFDDTKADIRTRKDREAAKKREAEEKERIRQLRRSLIGLKQNSRALAFAPFGAGQFQNDDNTKGIFFATTEGLTLATSFGIWGYLVNKYGIRSDQVPPLEAQRVYRLQQIEVGTGIAFIALYAISVVDANRHFKQQVRTEIDESSLPPELRDAPPPAKKKPVKTSLHIVPMLSPDGAGIGISWENY